MERVAGIEPASSAWKAEVLPLNYTRGIGPRDLTPQRCLGQQASLHIPIPTGAAFNAAQCGKHGGGGWIRTTEAFASDLQSDPFGHSGTPPRGRTFS